jgi:hypothetical protein
MALLDFQTALGRLVRASERGDALEAVPLADVERSYLAALAGDAGFRFTVKVQRSWCSGRAAKAAYLTLSVLPAGRRAQLLTEWVGLGGGTRSFVGAESEAFLEFIGKRLPEPSHELSICQMERAALRAHEGMQHFRQPEPSEHNLLTGRVQRGRYAGLVRFFAAPEGVLNALTTGEPAPALSEEITALIFAPGFDRLYRKASCDEAALFGRLTLPVPVIELFAEGFRRRTIQELLHGGAVESAE